MLKRICSHCGKSIPVGTRCSCEKKLRAESFARYDREKRDQGRAGFYHMPDWQRIRAAVKNRADGLDQYALAEQHMICQGTTAHHIATLEEAPELSCDINNLIWVDEVSHARIHKIYNESPTKKLQLQDKLRAIITGKPHE